MTDDEQPPTVELRLADIQRALDVGLTEIRGQLGLLIQRAAQQDQRTEELSGRIDRHDERLRAVEQQSVTKTELDQRGRRTWVVAGVLVAAIGIVVSSAVSVIVAAVT